MAYLTVTTQVDVVDPGDGKLSLREAVAQANAGAGADTIRFVAGLSGKKLVLTGGELVIAKDLTIDGTAGGKGRLDIDGNDRSRVFRIAGRGTEVSVHDLAVTHGNSGGHDGGGFLLEAGNSLTLTNVDVRGNSAGDYFTMPGSGGGIFVGVASRLIVTGGRIVSNYAYNPDRGGGGIFAAPGSFLQLIGTRVEDNAGFGYRYGSGGGIVTENSMVVLRASTIAGNRAGGEGAGILAVNAQLTLIDSTVANNSISGHIGNGQGGGISASGTVALSSSTITGNFSQFYGGDGSGAGLFVTKRSDLAVSSSIVAGNASAYPAQLNDDIYGHITFSDGHNIFGTDVSGNIAGDRERMLPGAIFAAIDPATHGGKLNDQGVVSLRANLANPASGGGNPLLAGVVDQRGFVRPRPAGSLPDIGAVEIDQPPSTSPTVSNDVITGSNAANNLAGFAGNDLLLGLGGNDILNGNEGSDVLKGGPGNDKLNGGNGVDIATFAGATAVVVDLSTSAGTAKRGGATDQLTSIEGIIGSDKADTFKGDGQNNEFQGGLGKDTATGGGGRDLYAFRSVQDSPAGTGRDVIKDFVPGQDVLDVSNLDADSTLPGQQSFRWVGKATLTGAAQLGYYVAGGNTIVRASTDAAAEVEIQLNGVKTLTPTDFRF